MELFKPESVKFNWVKTFKIGIISSTILTLLSLIGFFKPGLNYGIDFRGGIEARVAFKDSGVTEHALREILQNKLENLSIVKYSGGTSTNEYSITAQSNSKEESQKIVKQTLATKYGEEGQAWTVSSFDQVGPRVSQSLRTQALLSLFYACLIITLYMYWRFDLRYSPGALACIFHDLTVVSGFIILTRTEFSTTVVAALLTLAGYSINDTVVVFDRIREIEHKFIGKDKGWVVNEAINSTLSRTILTSGTTFVSCLVLYFLGGAAIKDFAFVLLVGIFVGTYSSVFVAAPLYIWADKKFAHHGEAQAKKV